MAPIEVYGMQLSAPVRIVQMTAECLGVEYTMKQCDLMTGEHMKPEYLKLNPMHNIPTVVDGELAMNESRAIAGYLVNKHGKDDSLYPKDPETRYKVDHRMYFDMGTFYKAFGDLVYPVMMPGSAPLPEQKQQDRFKEVMGWLNNFVADGKYAAGTDHLTLADICLVSTYSTLLATEAFDLSEYSNLEAWFNKCKENIPNYEKANGEGAAAFGGWYKSKVA